MQTYENRPTCDSYILEMREKKPQKYKNLPATCVANVSELKKLQTHENM